MSFRALMRAVSAGPMEQPNLCERTRNAIVQALDFDDLHTLAAGVKVEPLAAGGAAEGVRCLSGDHSSTADYPAVHRLLRDCGYSSTYTAGDVSHVAAQVCRSADFDSGGCWRPHDDADDSDGADAVTSASGPHAAVEPHWVLEPGLRDAMIGATRPRAFRGLRPAKLIAGGRRATRCVCRVDTLYAAGSGVLVRPDLLLTSSVLIASAKQAAAAEITLLRDAPRCDPLTLVADPHSRFCVGSSAGLSFPFVLQSVLREDTLRLQIQTTRHTSATVTRRGAAVRVVAPGHKLDGLRGHVQGVVGDVVLLRLPPPYGRCTFRPDQLRAATATADPLPSSQLLPGRRLPHGSLVSLPLAPHCQFEVVGDEDEQLQITLRSVDGTPHQVPIAWDVAPTGWGLVHRLGTAGSWCLVSVRVAEPEKVTRQQQEQLRRIADSPVALTQLGSSDVCRRQALNVITHTPERTADTSKWVCVGTARTVSCGPGRPLEAAVESARGAGLLPGLSDGAAVFDDRWRLLGVAGASSATSRPSAAGFQCVTCATVLDELRAQGLEDIVAPRVRTQQAAPAQQHSDASVGAVRKVDPALKLRPVPSRLSWGQDRRSKWLAGDPSELRKVMTEPTTYLPPFEVCVLDAGGDLLESSDFEATVTVRALTAKGQLPLRHDEAECRRGVAKFPFVEITSAPTVPFRLVATAEYHYRGRVPYPLSRRKLTSSRVPQSAIGPLTSPQLTPVARRPSKKR